jgi:O-antigen ligase
LQKGIALKERANIADLNNSTMRRTFASVYSKLLWLFLLAWVARVTVFLRQRSATDFSTIDIFALVQIGIVLCIFIQILLSGRFMAVWSETRRTSILLIFLYYALCLLSSFWSPIPKFSAYRAIEFMILLMGVLIALSYAQNFAEAERNILFISLLVILFSVYVNFKFHGFSLSFDDWHTNSYTASGGMVFCYCLCEYFMAEKERKTRLIKYGFIGFSVLLIGTSTASFIAVFCGIIFVTIIKRKIVLLIIFSFFLVLFLVIRLIGFDFFASSQAIVFYGKSEDAITTMSGRIHMWQIFLELVQKSPIYGHGFAVLSTGRGGVFASDPHNSLFSILLGTGALGMATFLLYALRLIYEILKAASLRLPGAIGCAAAISMGLVNSLAMPLIFDEFEESSLVFICISALFILFVYLPNIRKVKSYQNTSLEKQPMKI